MLKILTKNISFFLLINITMNVLHTVESYSQQDLYNQDILTLQKEVNNYKKNGYLYNNNNDIFSDLNELSLNIQIFIEHKNFFDNIPNNKSQALFKLIEKLQKIHHQYQEIVSKINEIQTIKINNNMMIQNSENYIFIKNQLDSIISNIHDYKNNSNYNENMVFINSLNNLEQEINTFIQDRLMNVIEHNEPMFRILEEVNIYKNDLDNLIRRFNI